MTFNAGRLRARLAALVFVLVSTFSVNTLADDTADAMRHRAKLAHLEAQQAQDLHSKFQAMATQARELVYTLPAARRPDASKRADVLQKSAERAQITHSKLAAYADELDRQVATLDIAAADRRVATQSEPAPVLYDTGAVQASTAHLTQTTSDITTHSIAKTESFDQGAGTLAREARALAEQAKTNSAQLRVAVNEAKAQLMQFDANPGSVDPQRHEQAREKVRSLTQEAKIAAWQYRDLNTKASELEARALAQ